MSVLHCVGMYPAYICIFLHEHVYENATVVTGSFHWRSSDRKSPHKYYFKHVNSTI